MAKRLGRSGQGGGPQRQTPGPNAASRRKDRPVSIRPAVSEAALHQSVAEYLDWLLLPPTVWTTVGHGWGALGKATAGMLKAAGLKPGMPDILIFQYGRVTGLELKVKGRRRSPVQIEMADKLRKVGVYVYECRSLEEVVWVLGNEDIPYRKHLIDGKVAHQSAAKGGQAQPAPRPSP